MASIQGSNPLDRLASYFKPCTKEFSQEEYYNVEDTFTELQERQPKNPLNNLDVFFQPLTKKFEESNDEIWTHNPFVEKIEIESSLGIKSPRSNKLLTKSSSKRRRIDDDEYKRLPLLSTTVTSSDTSSSESSDEEGDIDIFPSLQVCDDKGIELQFDDNIIKNLKTLSLVSDNPKTAMTSRKIAKPKSKKLDAASDEDPKKPTIEKRSEKSLLEVAQPVDLEGKEKGKEVLRTISKKIEEGKSYQKTSNINGIPGTSRAGFIGSQAFNYLDILDNQAFKVRHQKVITKKVREANLSGGLSSLLSSGFKPTSMLG